MNSLHDKNPENRLIVLVFLTGVIALALVEIAWLSLAQYRGYNMKYFDLGAMSQAIWSATQGLPLVFTGSGLVISRLARNVELFYFLLAPLYALFPTPKALLVFQAFLYAVGAIPLFKLARRHLEDGRFSVVIAAIYLFYPVAQTSVLFEFHGDALAMPLLLFAIEAMDRKAWLSYFIWLVLALSCKWYVGVPVSVMGMLLWWQGQRRIGIATAVLGLAWTVAAFGIIRPLYAPPGEDAVQARATASVYLQTRFNALDLRVTWMPRLLNGVIVLMPAIIVLGWRAAVWLIPAVVVFLPALLSSGFGPSYSYQTHHYALTVPFLIAAVTFGAAKLHLRQKKAQTDQEWDRAKWKGRVFLTLLVVMIFNVAFVDTPLNPRFFLPEDGSGTGLDSSRYGVLPRDNMKDVWLTEIVPDAVPLASDELLATRLLNRKVVYLTIHHAGPSIDELLPSVEYVVTDALYDYAVGDGSNPELIYEGGVIHEHSVINALVDSPHFNLLAANDGLLLFGREGRGLMLSLKQMSRDESDAIQAKFGDAIGLIDTSHDHLGDNRYQMRWDWLPLRSLENEAPLIAVSRLEGVKDTRIVHLPTLVMQPTNTWRSGEIIREIFDVEIPNDLAPGRYPLIVAWYETDNLFAASTDERSRVGQEIQVGEIEVD